MSFCYYDPYTNTEQLQHSHTCMGAWDQMYGANNEPASKHIIIRTDPVDRHTVNWKGETWRWWMTDSETYYDKVNSDWQNSFNPPSSSKLINRVKVHKKN